MLRKCSQVISVIFVLNIVVFPSVVLCALYLRESVSWSIEQKRSEREKYRVELILRLSSSRTNYIQYAHNLRFRSVSSVRIEYGSTCRRGDGLARARLASHFSFMGRKAFNAGI